MNPFHCPTQQKAAQQGQGEGRAGLTFCQAHKTDKLNNKSQHNTSAGTRVRAGPSFSNKETLLFSPTEMHPKMLEITVYLSLITKKNPSENVCFSFVELAALRTVCILLTAMLLLTHHEIMPQILQVKKLQREQNN